MKNTQPLTETNVPGFKLSGRGKVRDIYDLGDRLMIISTDRFSAFDVILGDPIYPRGPVLNRLTHFWFNALPVDVITPNHCVSINPADFPPEFRQFAGRAMLAWKAEKVFPVECIVRGYLEGSGFKDYQKTGRVCGIELSKGLRRGDRLPEPIFTPSTKAEQGLHDENITYEQACEIVGAEVANILRQRTLGIYKAAHEFALQRGVIIADTKFEFGLIRGVITLVDEVLNPDSSRFWPKSLWTPGQAQLSFDKQFVRDYLQGLCDAGQWDKTPPAPPLPAEVIAKTREKYLEAYSLLTGTELPEATEAA